MAGINVPVGISDFEKIRRNGYYYVDKTGLILELLKGEAAEVTLITRPRRFGKTLGMSMLASFFDIRKDSRDMFSRLSVMRDEKLCRTWMNQRPERMQEDCAAADSLSEADCECPLYKTLIMKK